MDVRGVFESLFVSDLRSRRLLSHAIQSLHKVGHLALAASSLRIHSLSTSSGQFVMLFAGVSYICDGIALSYVTRWCWRSLLVSVAQFVYVYGILYRELEGPLKESRNNMFITILILIGLRFSLIRYDIDNT